MQVQSKTRRIRIGKLGIWQGNQNAEMQNQVFPRKLKQEDLLLLPSKFHNTNEVPPLTLIWNQRMMPQNLCTAAGWPVRLRSLLPERSLHH
jgi:hypothetical protein